MQVSITIITRNEEQRIRAALESVRWAQDIVVVDCGSTDRTTAIAREFTDRVIHHEFTDFASQKNFAHTQARHDWVLNLDADECCTSELAAEIQALPENAADGYYISRRNYFQGRRIRHCGWSPDYKLRLYRRSNAVWEGKVHESVQISGPGRTVRLRGSLDHYTYRGFERYLQSIHQFAKLAAIQMQEQGRSAGIADLMFRPPGAFIKKYLLQLGILDGSPGLVISVLTAYGIFCRYALLRELSEGKAG